jgi:hypothetical protein
LNDMQDNLENSSRLSRREPNGVWNQVKGRQSADIFLGALLIKNQGFTVTLSKSVEFSMELL